jgi:molecular chaperone GrpE
MIGASQSNSTDSFSGVEDLGAEARTATDKTEATADAQLKGGDVALSSVLPENEQLLGQLRTVSKAYADLQEEMKGFKKRIEQREALKVQRRLAEVVQGFLDPIDNLRRSLDAQQNKSDETGLADGLAMICQQFEEALVQLGLENVPGVGALFNPTYHEALTMMPVKEKSQDGRVIAVQTSGYTIAGRVVQVAKVIVGHYVDVAPAPDIQTVPDAVED